MASDLNITIIEEDPFVRAILQASLAAALPEVACTVLASDQALAHSSSFKLADYFSKPFRVGAVIDRVRRMASAKENVPYVIGAYDLDVEGGMLMDRDNGKEIRLTEKENEILKILYAAQGEAVSKDILLAQVWGYVPDIETHTLETHIYRLRQKIERDAAAPVLLITQEDGYALRF